MAEILKTINSTHTDNGDGTITARVGSAPLNYLDNGEWKEISLDAEDKGTYWEFTKNNQRLFVAKDFAAPQLLRLENLTGDANQTMYFEPTSLTWVNNTDLSDKVEFRAAQSVQGVIDGNRIVWTDAFGTGLDYEVVFSRGQVSKNLVINALNNLENPPTPDHKLVLLSKFTGDGLKLRKKGEVDWDRESYIEVDEEFEVSQDKTVEFVDEDDIPRQITIEILNKAKFLEAVIWDELDRKQRIKVAWLKKDNVLWQGKILPKQFLLNATYPVRTDTTIDTYGLNSKQVTNDNYSGTYNAACTVAAGDATYAITAAALHNTVHDSDITNWYIRKADMQFDTSSIPSGATVSALSFTQYSHSSGNGDADSFNLIAVDNTNNGSLSNPIVTGDFDAFDDDSAAIGTKAFADYLDKNANVTMTLTDFDVIAKGSGAVTRIGLQSENCAIELRDGSASDPTGSNVTRVAMSSDFPYLDVTYSPGTDITLDSATYAQSNVGTSLTFSHTCSGSDRLLIVCGHDKSAAASVVTGVTYNSVSMTLAGGYRGTGGRYVTMWYLVAPATGSNSVVVSASESVDLRFSAVSYTSVNQSTPEDATLTSTDNGWVNSTTYTHSHTTSNNRALTFMFGKDNTGSSTYSTSSEQTILLNTDAGGHFIMVKAIPTAQANTLNGTLDASVKKKSLCWSIREAGDAVATIPTPNLLTLGAG